MPNKACLGNFNVKQTLREKDADIQTLISLNNKQNIIKTAWKIHKSIIILETKESINKQRNIKKKANNFVRIFSGIFHRFIFFVYWYRCGFFYTYLNYFEDNKCITSLLFYIMYILFFKASSHYHYHLKTHDTDAFLHGAFSQIKLMLFYCVWRRGKYESNVISACIGKHTQVVTQICFIWVFFLLFCFVSIVFIALTFIYIFFIC